MSIGNAMKRGGTTYEFSTSNPMWRASLEGLDFLPMNTVDYSGGMIILTGILVKAMTLLRFQFVFIK